MHSSARRSDLPIYDQSRTSAAYMLESIRELPPEAVIIENVPEWERQWSRLDPHTMRPVKGHEGEYFQAFVKALRDLSYEVEWRKINAADLGAFTSRVRQCAPFPTDAASCGRCKHTLRTRRSIRD